jgi:hypothetical protein
MEQSMTAVEFELAILGPPGQHTVDVYIVQPGSDAPIQPLAGQPRGFAVDLTVLDGAEDDLAYGQGLADALFADRDVQSAFDRARSIADSLRVPLRFRLAIAPEASNLQQIRWELLTVPAATPRAHMLMRDDVLFSRYIASGDFRRIPLRARSELRALIVVASPSGLDRRNPPLAAIDAVKEIAAASAALDPIPAKPLPRSQPVTLAVMIEELRTGYDILYLVCHGSRARDNGEPLLLFEGADGTPEIVRGEDLIAQVSELSQPPRLIVLASCQSAGPDGVSRTQDEGALAALGPRLAATGIGAVIAMQGKVSLDTVSEFMPAFFKEMAASGRIDGAMAAGRSRVRKRDDWWMPTLFMRLRSGRVAWYDAGFRSQFDRWPALLQQIANGRCTPILGPGVTDHVVGNRRDTARRLAEGCAFPMARPADEDLPQVAQYLKVMQSSEAVPGLVLRHLCAELIDRDTNLLAPELKPSDLNGLSDRALADLYERLIETAWRRRLRESNEPLSMLASLNCPLYVTTNPDELLHRAVSEAQFDAATKAPHSEIARWKQELSRRTSIFDLPADPVAAAAASAEYSLDVKRPVIYKLFGSWSDTESLVITEDDYFDFLIGVTENKDLIPTPIRGALANSALLFLGFHLDDWDFRVLFRSLATQQGRTMRQRYAHVAVQIAPEEGRVVRPEQARKFLADWYDMAGQVSIFWGTVQDFVHELHRQRTGQDPAAAGALFARR